MPLPRRARAPRRSLRPVLCTRAGHRGPHPCGTSSERSTTSQAFRLARTPQRFRPPATALPRNTAERVFADTLAQLRARPDLVILVILTINLLSAVDAVLTLNALSLGAQKPTLSFAPLWSGINPVDMGQNGYGGGLSFALWALRQCHGAHCGALRLARAFTATLMWHRGLHRAVLK